MKKVGALLVVLALTACRSGGEGAVPAPAPPPRTAPSAAPANGRDTGVAASAPAPRRSPFAVVATVGGFGRIHTLADGELLFASRGVFRRLTPTGGIERVGEVDSERRGLEIANYVDAIVAVGGALAGPLVVATNQGHFRSSYVSRTFTYEGGRFVARKGAKAYDKVVRWRDDVLLGHLSGASYDTSSFRPPDHPTPFAIASGKKTTLPELPKDFVVVAWTAFGDGSVFAIGGVKDPELGALGASATALAWAPGSRAPTPVTLPDLPAEPWIDVVTGPRADALWLAGSGGYLARVDARGAAKVKAPCDEIITASAAGDGALYLVCGDQRRAAFDSTPVVHKVGKLVVRAGESFEELPLPDFTKATYADPIRSSFYEPPYNLFVGVEDAPTVAPPEGGAFVLYDVAARGPDDVWLLAYDADEDRTVILRRGEARAVRALDHEDAVRDNEQPAPAASRACEAVFVSLGASTASARAKVASVRYVTVRPFVARVHQSEHLGFVTAGRPPRAFQEARVAAAEWATLGFPSKLLCRRPVALSMPFPAPP